MLQALFRALARLPLPLLHGLGILTGYLYFLLLGKRLRRARKNLRQYDATLAPAALRRLLHANVRETGKSFLEIIAVWFRPDAARLVRDCRGWQQVEAARAAGRGIIFLTPHLGCYEITAIYYATHHPISVLYKPPRNEKLATLVASGRRREGITLAPTTMGGIRTLLKTLRQGGTVGILPDQVPEENEGTWADFLGKPAYTMTLVGKLAEASDAVVLLAFGERLSWGRGYVIHIEPLAAAGAPTPQEVNDGIARLIRRCPAQYLWSYARFKRP